MVVDAMTQVGSRELLLVLPGLPDATRCAGPALPRLRALETLIARGERSDGDDGSSMGMLQSLFPELAGAARIPAGPLSRLADTGHRDDAWWARADPVHLTPVRDHLRLLAGDPLTADEAGALAASCNGILAEHGLALEVTVPQRWYLRATRALNFSAGAPEAVIGCDVFLMLPAGPDGGFVRRVLTELQMVLHDHPVNRARARAGHLSVNSLWPWGGGVLPASSPTHALPWLRSDDPVLRGLWRFAGAASDALPETLAPVAPGIIITRSCEAAARDADAAACAMLLERIEAQWLQPILAGVRKASIDGARLLFGRHGTYTVDRRRLRRWWRRAKAPG